MSIILANDCNYQTRPKDIGLLHLCEGLKVAKCALETLVLWNNKISTKSINAMADALVLNTKLVTLNLGQNAIQVQFEVSRRISYSDMPEYDPLAVKMLSSKDILRL